MSYGDVTPFHTNVVWGRNPISHKNYDVTMTSPQKLKNKKIKCEKKVTEMLPFLTF